MADSTTPNYGWSYPTVNADANSWGTTLNATFVAIDGQMKTNALAACQTANSLSDIASAAAARTNLGLGSAATQAVTAFLQPGNNLSDLSNAGTARANLGLGTAATSASSAFDATGAASTAQSNAIAAAEAASCQRSSNLSDLANIVAARANLALGSAAITTITVSTGGPSGTPANGDVWYQI
ncbi:MAG: hypothetical protein ACREFW_07105 [Rhizomicrobium sp.]